MFTLDKPRSAVYGFFLASIAVLCWGTMFPVGRLVFSQDMIDPYTLCGLRFFLAGVVMLTIQSIPCIINKNISGRISIGKRDWFVLLGAGILAMAHVLLLCFAQKTIPAINASMIEAFVPIQIFLLSIILGYRPRSIQLLGLFIGFFGSLLTLKIVDAHGFYLESYTWGDGLILFSALCWSTYIILGRGTIQRLGSWTFTAWSFLFGGLIIVPFMFLTPNRVPGIQNSVQWQILAYYILIPTILGFVCWNAAQKYLTLGTLSFLAYFNPLVAAVGGVFVVREYLTWEQVIGAVCIIGAALTESSSKR